MRALSYRVVLVHLRRIPAQPPVQLLPRTDLHSDCTHRHPVLGVLLDRRDSCSCADHTRDPHCPNDDVTEYHHQSATATCLLHKGGRASYATVGMSLA